MLTVTRRCLRCLTVDSTRVTSALPMEVTLKIHPHRLVETYYRRLPSRAHSTGDLWRALPTFDLLPQKFTAGLVITPACDLANDKTPTISYLPIIPVSEYLLAVHSYGCVRPVILELLGKAKRQDLGVLFPRSPEPSLDDLSQVEQEISTIAPQGNASKRILDGVRVLSRTSEAPGIRLQWLSSCISEAKWSTLLERIVSNSHADDIHFLPPDGLSPDFSAIVQPSVALFRVPLTLQRSWFDRQMSNEAPQALDPLKTGTLNAPFLTDLLTRFARLYIRIGSPDLADESISQLVARVESERIQ